MRFLLLLLPLLTVAACPLGKKIGSVDNGDAGPSTQTISCNLDSDCPEDVPTCSFGACKRPCAANDGCVDPATYCNVVSGYCEPGCRDSTTCGAGKVCSGGACIESTGCGSNCDCDPGQVCSNGSCTAPPGQCNGADDCPRGPDTCAQYSCNGFTHECFDPNPTPCTTDTDCSGRLGCEGGCTCVDGSTDHGTCATNVQCTAQNEATTCGAGFYCGSGTCQAAPTCTSDAQCTAAGLVCNTGTGQCERALPCTSSTDCTTPPNTFCTNSGRCGQPLCNNGGPGCTTGQTCTADGRCVTQGTGAPCTTDAQCQANEYCALVNGTGSCAVGCRDNASCDPGQSCNGSHTCIGGGGGGLQGWQGTCSSDSDCQAGLFCGGFTHVCQEACTPGATGACAQDGCCTLSGAQCCQQLLVPVCSNTGC